MKKCQKLDNLICVCGHLYSQHEPDEHFPSVPIFVDGKVCSVRKGDNDEHPNDYVDDCISFKPDNLKFIEKKYGETSK